jgi:hypothetical protein
MIPRLVRRPWLVTVAVLGAAAAGYVFLATPPLAELFGGREGLRIISRPTNVETYLLGELPPEIQPEEATPFDFPVVRGPMQASNAAANDASAALRSVDSYGWDYAKACGPPIYGARLSFHREQERIDVYLCFMCDYLCVCRDGEVIGGEYFDPARTILLNAIKDCYPDFPDVRPQR